LPKKHTLTLPSETLEIDKMKMGWKNESSNSAARTPNTETILK
jgi:hypothetical protein